MWSMIEIPSSPPSTKLIGGTLPGFILVIGTCRSANFTSWTIPSYKKKIAMKQENVTPTNRFIFVKSIKLSIPGKPLILKFRTF